MLCKVIICVVPFIDAIVIYYKSAIFLPFWIRFHIAKPRFIIILMNTVINLYSYFTLMLFVSLSYVIYFMLSRLSLNVWRMLLYRFVVHEAAAGNQ